MDRINNETLIKLENITKVFYTDEIEIHALWGVHLEIRKNEYVPIAGPSAWGTSTLLSIIGLLDSATSGVYPLKEGPWRTSVIRNAPGSGTSRSVLYSRTSIW